MDIYPGVFVITILLPLTCSMSPKNAVKPAQKPKMRASHDWKARIKPNHKKITFINESGDENSDRELDE